MKSLGLVLYVMFFALLFWVGYKASPLSRLDLGEAEKKPTTVPVKMPEQAKVEEVKPKDAVPPMSQLKSLTPSSLSQTVNMGSVYSFAGSGAGNGIAGAGETGDLVASGTEHSRSPRLLRRAQVDYPREAKVKNIQGYVGVKLKVGLNGQVEEVEITDSEPAGVFDRVVLISVRQWQFEPGMVNGRVAVLWTKQRVRFELDGGQ